MSITTNLYVAIYKLKLALADCVLDEENYGGASKLKGAIKYLQTQKDAIRYARREGSY